MKKKIACMLLIFGKPHIVFPEKMLKKGPYYLAKTGCKVSAFSFGSFLHGKARNFTG